MKLSTSLYKGLMEVGVGSVLNRFKINSRRDILIFEDLVCEHFQYLQEKGKGEVLFRVGKEWAFLCINNLLPSIIRKLGVVGTVENFCGPAWKNIGVLESVEIKQEGKEIILKTEGETISSKIGPNRFMEGFFAGVLSALYKQDITFLNSKNQSGIICYRFKIRRGKFHVKGRKKTEYDKLNKTRKVEGFRLKDLMKKGLVKLKEGNKLEYRGKRMFIFENTALHLFGINSELLEGAEIASRNFFSELVDEKAGRREKLFLMKNLLQIMGWGKVRLILKDRTVKVVTTELPHGLHSGPENWDYLDYMVLGYLKIIDEGTELVSSCNRGGTHTGTYNIPG